MWTSRAPSTTINYTKSTDHCQERAKTKAVLLAQQAKTSTSSNSASSRRCRARSRQKVGETVSLVKATLLLRRTKQLYSNPWLQHQSILVYPNKKLMQVSSKDKQSGKSRRAKWVPKQSFKVNMVLVQSMWDRVLILSFIQWLKNEIAGVAKRRWRQAEEQYRRRSRCCSIFHRQIWQAKVARRRIWMRFQLSR